jgi:hypothetical protein
MRGDAACPQLILIAAEDGLITGLLLEGSALEDDRGAGLGERLLGEDDQGTAGAVGCLTETEPGG